MTLAPFPPWLQRLLPTGTRRRMVRIGEHHMHVMEVGEGRPVLMVHGNPSWGFLYRKVAAELARDGFRLLMPDLLGLGFSSRVPPEAHTIDAHAGWLRDCCDESGVEHPILVVQDWGGAIGVLSRAGRALDVSGLVVLNTVLSEPKPGFRPTLFHRLSHAPLLSDLAYRWLGLPHRAMVVVQGDRSSISGAVARAYRFPLRNPIASTAPLALARMGPDSHEHPSIEPLRRCREAIQSYSGPAAIVWGERDPILGSVRGWIEKLLPQAHTTRTSAGHFLQEEVPFEIAEAVRGVAVSTKPPA